MISCTEFIPAYNELFKFIEEKEDKEAVIGFWNYLSDTFLMNLKNQVVEFGIKGCWIYWSKTLKEEALLQGISLSWRHRGLPQNRTGRLRTTF